MIEDRASNEAVEFILQLYKEGYAASAITKDLDYNQIVRPSSCRTYNDNDYYTTFWNTSLVLRILKKHVSKPVKRTMNTPKYVVNFILGLKFNERKSYAYIANELNNNGISNHQFRNWKQETIKKLVQRHCQRNGSSVNCFRLPNC